MYSKPSSIRHDISLSIISSGLFAIFIELGFVLNDKFKFGYLGGKWERTSFYNRNSNESGHGYNDISDRYLAIPKQIQLRYQGEGEYTGTATYEEGRLSLHLTINKENVLTGNGSYQYYATNSQAITADLGHYSFMVDKTRKKIYISHQNILPSGTAKGLEIWERE